MCNSMVYAVNSASQDFVSTGTTINFGSVVRRYGCHTNVNGTNATVFGSGYYSILAYINGSGASGTIDVQLYKDGTPINGAHATLNVATGVNVAVTIPAVIRQRCNCESTITAVISGTDGTIVTSSITVAKL